MTSRQQSTRPNQIAANRFYCKLKQLADSAYERREIDPRWQEIAKLLDSARRLARAMMSEKDRQETPE